MFGSPEVLLLALGLDAVIGDPAALYARLPHPVAIIGRGIGGLDQRFNRDQDPIERRRTAGIAVCLVLVILSFGIGWLLHRSLRSLPGGWIAEALLMSAFLAQNSLYRHVAAVAQGLAGEGLPGGRRAVARIVGRDPESLDEPAVCRAALESLAENFSDGVTAPLFWALLLGLPGILVYKAVNTADSMIGHRSPRHLAFGWASARLDDLLNLIPARLAALVFLLAAFVAPRTSPARALRALRQDARRHRSPNAGWPEAAMAGALGLALAGPRRYGGVIVEDHWMNLGGRRDATPADIQRGLALYVCACLLQAIVVALIAIF
jgi:adenosylcobinamide-phosphate synthase